MTTFWDKIKGSEYRAAILGLLPSVLIGGAIDYGFDEALGDSVSVAAASNGTVAGTIALIHLVIEGICRKKYKDRDNTTLPTDTTALLHAGNGERRPHENMTQVIAKEVVTALITGFIGFGAECGLNAGTRDGEDLKIDDSILAAVLLSVGRTLVRYAGFSLWNKYGCEGARNALSFLFGPTQPTL